MTKRAQQRARLVSFGGSDDEDDEASELVAFMNDEDVNRLWDSPKVRAMPILYYLLVGFVDYIDLPPKEDSYSNLAESFTSSSSQWRVTKWTHVFVRLIPRLWLSLPSLRYPLLYYPVNLICVFNTVLSQRAMGHSYWLRRLRCFAGFCESGPRSSGVCAN